ncbi:MAG TPA: response regulator [Kofleriaceae bacterium]|nr:response regulator [Kofleriaceae bacterium]
MELPRLLVVDDDAFVCELVRRALRDRYVVVVDTAASQALERLCDGQRFAAILCDVMMPGASGLDLLAHVRRDFPEQAVSFTLLTAAPTEELVESGVPFLAKPFRRDDLVRFVDAHAITLTSDGGRTARRDHETAR